MPTPLEEAENRLGEKLGAINQNYEQIRGDLTKVREAQEELQAAHQQVQDALAQNRAHVADGSESEYRRYTTVDEAEYKHNRGHYITTDAGACRMYGHVNKHGFYERGLLDDPEPKHEWQREIQREMTLRNIVRSLSKPDGYGHVRTPGCDARIRFLAGSAPSSVRRVIEAHQMIVDNDVRVRNERIASGGAAGSGAEWVPQNLFPELEREIKYQTGVHSIFDDRPLPPSGKMTVPRRTGNYQVYKTSAPTTNDPANYKTSDVASGNDDISAVRLVIATQMDEDLPEESIYFQAPEIMTDMAHSWALALDDIATNGDDTAAHQDDIANWNIRSQWSGTLGLPNDHRRSCKGLRRLAFDKNTDLDMNTIQTEAGLRQLLASIAAQYGGRPGDLKLQVNWEFLIRKMWGWTEFQTWEKAGPHALTLTGLLGGKKGMSPGSVGLLYGMIEVVVNWALTADLASTGLYTGSGATTSMLLHSRSDFEWRTVPGVTLQQASEIRNGTITSVMKRKTTFRDRAPGGNSTANVANGINLTLT